MSGRSPPTRRKALPIAFLLILVLSMVAGSAAFAGSAAGIETIEDGDVDDLDIAAGVQNQQISFTLEDGTDYDGDSSGTATVDIDITTADDSLAVTSATLDSLVGSSSNDVSSGDSGIAVTGNTATLSLDENELTNADSTVEVTLMLTDVDAGTASTSDVSYDVVSNGDGGGDAVGETETAPFSITDSSDTTVDLSTNPITATADGGDITVTVTANEELVPDEITVANVDGKSAGGFTEVGTTGSSPYEYEATITGVSDGDYSVDVTNVKDSVGNTVDPAETGTADVKLGVHYVDELQIHADFIGIVADDNTTISLTASGFENADGATIVDREVDVNIGDNDYTVTIDQNSEVDANINPEEISADHETGETDVSVVGADAEDAATDTVTLVHEAHDLNEGWNLRSIPQPAELYEQNVDAVNQWNTGEETYDAGIADGVVSNAGDLHRGMYVDAGADGRLGYEFETDTVPTPGDVQLESGWHLASSNFAIDTDGATRALDDDLVNLPDADQPGITVYDDVQRTTLGGASTVNAYDTYWIFIDNPVRTDRGILAPNYSPSNRNSILSSE